jgi:glycogen operon protein
LSRTKLFATSWDGVDKGNVRHLADYNDGFLVDMRCLLKGDEDQLNHLAFRSRQNPKESGIINYMASSNGFTMMDMVSYERKHNEANGEDNRDGSNYNYSWNCGLEGPTKKKKIVELRKKQLRNAALMLFLSQGTPLLLGGDEFGNSKQGNNNAYCQDNEISWLNWNDLLKNKAHFEYVKHVIALRHKHDVVRKRTGRCSVGLQEIQIFKPDASSKVLRVVYGGRDERQQKDDIVCLAVNAYWEEQDCYLPHLPPHMFWKIEADAAGTYLKNGIPGDEGGHILRENKVRMQPRSAMILIGDRW